MTTPTLPTRPDGGIDWNRIAFSVFRDGIEVHILPDISTVKKDAMPNDTPLTIIPLRKFGPLVAAHERERCARVADQHGTEWLARKIAAEIREMEP